MGYWPQDKAGNSFAINPESEMIWGDGPADTIDATLEEIFVDYRQQHNRLPSPDEIRQMLQSALSGETPQSAFAKALKLIQADFERDWDRAATREEILAGLEFSLSIYDLMAEQHQVELA